MDFQQKICEDVWYYTYKWETDNTVYDSFKRTAKYISSVEKRKEQKKYSEIYYELLSKRRYVCGGRILANAGTGLTGTSMINCFVDGFKGQDQDSLEGIFNTVYKASKILKSEGGYGFCLNTLRPRGGYVKGIGVETCGAVEFLKLWNVTSNIITKGNLTNKKNTKGKNKIRKGAMMVTLSIEHPSIEEFITAKRNSNDYDKFNMSVLISDDFMKALKEDSEWITYFPDTTYEKYNLEWDGDLRKWKNKNYPIIKYQTYKAKDLWNTIMQSTYDFAEPGILFIDRINYFNNLYYCENILSTNACVAKGSYVQTPEGIKKVEDINIGDYVSTLHPNGYEPVKDIEAHENIDIYKINFSDGGTQYVTQNHKYHVIKKGKESKKIEKISVKDINIGDYVQVKPIDIEGIVDYSSLEYKKSLIAGVLLGDGCYTQKQYNKNNVRIAINIDEIDYNNNLMLCLKDIGFNSRFIHDNKLTKSAYIFIENGKNLCDLLQLTPSYSYEKTIPDFYFKNKNKIIGILEGLFNSDGSINLKSNHPQIRYKSTSLILVQQIRRLLLNIGCHCSASSSFLNDGGTIQNRKIIRKNKIYEIIISGISFSNLSFYLYNSIHTIKKEKIKIGIFNFNLTGNTYKAKVLNIEYYGKSKVYDIYCEESDTWITDGYVQQGCGEQPLPIGNSCNLGSINLTQYINSSKTDFNYEQLKKDIPYIVRFQDSIIDLTYFPLDYQYKETKSKRRLGIGYTGYASALYILKIPYGSKKAIKLTENLVSFVTNELYKCSAFLAKEKGKFSKFDKEKYLNSNFIKNALNNNTIKIIKKYGLRNSHLTTQAPTGNSGIFTNNISTGIEPVILDKYTRTVTCNVIPENLNLPTEIDWISKKYKSNTKWDFITEGKDTLLQTIHDNITYKYDINRGLTYEETVYDYTVFNNLEEFLKDKENNKEYIKNIYNLKVEEHINTLKIFSKYVDSSISKTVNIPNNYSFEDFKNVYLDAYNSNTIKGLTTYREGSMMGVVSSNENKTIEKDRHSPKRPKDLECDIYRIKVKDDEFTVLVGLLEGKPYECFCDKNHISITQFKKGIIRKEAKRCYNLIVDDEIIINNIAKEFDITYGALTRMISMSLRHNVSLEYIVDQLSKSDEFISFDKAISRVLKKYIKENQKVNLSKTCPNCGSTNLVYKEGCAVCMDCNVGLCN